MAWDIQKLFIRHAQELRRSLRRRGLSDDNAADLTQDTFVRVMTASPMGTDENPRAYLFQVSRNLATDFERRARAAPFLAITDDIVEAVADPRPSVEKILYDRQRLLASQNALAELPERTRRAFVLHRLEGLSIAEIGPLIGLSTTQTWSIIRDAYRHVRDRLKEI
nr:sigma-70 family RNA polymerase sigma factor [uncultured Shinella sp.]